MPRVQPVTTVKNIGLNKNKSVPVRKLPHEWKYKYEIS